MNDFREAKRQALLDTLRRHIAGEVRFDATSCRLYSTDASIYQIKPMGVVLPRTADDLQSVVQIAAETDTPIVARGGGTSLSGQSIGAGIVVDCSKYLDHIGPIDATGRRVRVQPGVVLDQLNRALTIHGLQFGPDVATANRATLGGMIGNNSAGSRSIVYGKTVDHVASLKTILSDGSIAEFSPASTADLIRRAGSATREGQIYRNCTKSLSKMRTKFAGAFHELSVASAAITCSIRWKITALEKHRSFLCSWAVKGRWPSSRRRSFNWFLGRKLADYSCRTSIRYPLLSMPWPSVLNMHHRLLN